MKKLILVRHGKSSWEYAVSDRDRPLLERGINDAILVSNTLVEQAIEIDAIFSSPANRALHTCTIFLRQLYLPLSKLELRDELYDFSGNEALKMIKSIADDFNTVMIFGHNHAFTHIANSLGNSYIDNVPTSGLVELNFNVNSWSLITKGTTQQIIFPKQLK
ncbi:histidine phosphatase family protein [Kriegella sp. EG-1]|nr:histidine phosphatase family protein [Flavobacteriaceae bacterium EG-1]